MKKQVKRNTKITSASHKSKQTKKKRRRIKVTTVMDVDNWIEDQFTDFLDSKYIFYIKRACVIEDKSRLTMAYRCSDTEKGAESKSGYIYCKLWGSKNSKLYMYKDIKNKVKSERRIAKEILKMISPFIMLAGIVVGVYIANKFAAPKELPDVSAQQIITEETSQENTENAS